MQVPYRINSTILPTTFVNLGNGQWYYNYDIQSHVENTEYGEQTVYDYIQIRTTGKPTYKDCVKKIIRLYIDESQEFDLINSYNMAFYNLLDEDEAQIEADKYLEYLTLVKEIKQKIKQDF